MSASVFNVQLFVALCVRYGSVFLGAHELNSSCCVSAEILNIVQFLQDNREINNIYSLKT